MQEQSKQQKIVNKVGKKGRKIKKQKQMTKFQIKKQQANRKRKERKQEQLKNLKREKQEKNEKILKNIQEDPIRKGKKGRLIVRNLIVDINEKLLRKLLGRFGTIEEVSIPTNPQNGLAKGFAFVQFANQFEAIAAIKDLHETMYKGRKITLDFSVDKRMYKGADQKPKVVDLEENGVLPEAEETGKIEQETQQEEIEEEGEAAEENEDFLEIEGGSDDEEEADGEEQEDEGGIEEEKEEDMSSTIFLRNVDYESTEEDVKKRFGNWGKVLYTKLVYDTLGDDSSHKGVGFVKFADSATAQRLIEISKKLSEDPLCADEVDPNNWLEFNTKQVKILPALRRENIQKMKDLESQKVDLNKIRKASAMAIVNLDIKDARNMSLAKLGLPVFENNLKVFMKLKGRSMGESTKGQDKEQFKWREKHLQEKVNKMRNPNYKLNPQRVLFKGISKEISHNDLRQSIISVLSQEGHVPAVLKKRWAEKKGKDPKPTGETGEARASVKQLQTVKLFKQVKVIKDAQKKGRSKGIAFVEFMEEEAAKVYMKKIKEASVYGGLQSRRKFIPIIEFTFMDMRMEKKMKGIREKMKTNAQKNDPKFQLVSEFKKKVTDSKKQSTDKKTKSPEEESKTRELKAKEHSEKCFKLLTEAVETKDRLKGIEAKKMINRIKSRGKRQRFLKKLYSAFEKGDLAKAKTKRIKKKAAGPQNGKKAASQKKPKKAPQEVGLKLNRDEKKELDDLFDQLGKAGEQLKE